LSLALHRAADGVLGADDARREDGVGERFFAALGVLELNVAHVREIAEALRGTA
jgi:hypothetical protein